MTININFPKYEGNFYLGENMQLTTATTTVWEVSWYRFWRYGMNAVSSAGM